MNSLETTLNTAATFEALNNIVQRAEAGLSFWGWRHISVPGYNDLLSIDILISCICRVIGQNPDFSEDDRESGKILANKIDQIYDMSDLLVSQSRCLTRLFVAVREWFVEQRASWRNWPYNNIAMTPRWRWRDCEAEGLLETSIRQLFACYTEQQYRNKFGHSPLEDVPHHCLRALGWSTNRWYRTAQVE